MTHDENLSNGNSWNRVAVPALGILALIGGMAAVIVPMHETSAGLQRQVDALAAWQERYVEGKVASSAAPKMAEMEQKFVEVETQFRAFKERMIENEVHTLEGHTRNTARIDALDERASGAREGLGRLDERVKEVERHTNGRP